MIIKDATFITSVASADKLYKTNKPIIAVAGKSNVGKSSLINMLANKKKLAKTSVTPGRTRLKNYFDFGDFILADLGVSSMQIDNTERGFSYKVEGPLDLRLNPQQGVSGAERLAELNRGEIEHMLIENADEPYASQIAANILKWRYMGKPIETTTNFRDCITEALSFLPKRDQKELIKKSCQRCFQALRIDVNSEFDVLYSFLEKLPSVLNAGGKVAVLTFHSGEDRLVKKGFQAFHRQGIYSDVARDVIRPSAEECIKNSRAKSTKMRWAIRSDLEE